MGNTDKNAPLPVASDVWQSIYALLSRELTDIALKTWFNECRIIELSTTQLVLHTPTRYKRDTIENKFMLTLRGALRELLPGDYNVRVLDDEGLEIYESLRRVEPEEDVDYTFDRFVVGNSNKFAQAAAYAVATGRAGRDYNPLFIYGESGLGKTHLLRAIRHTIRLQHPEYKIVYVKGDDFTNDLVRAIASGRNMEFREKYRFANVLLVDDIQFIAGKQQTQEEFFHTFNTLHDLGRQIVLTSDRPPREIARLDDRLRTRFEWGLSADISPPDYETRMAIIGNKAMELGFKIPEEIEVYIAENMSSNVRQLEGAVKKIRAYCEIYGIESLTVAEAARQIKDMLRENERAITAELIVNETAKFFMLSVDELKGTKRTRGTAQARQISWYLIRQMTPLSLLDIAKLFGRDHSTIISGLKNIEDGVKQGNEIAQSVKDITSNIHTVVESREMNTDNVFSPAK